MSSGGWGSYFGGGGRWSPWSRQLPVHTPEVRDSDYDYVHEVDIVEPSSDFYYATGGRHGHSDDEPDIIQLKHKANRYELQFSAYSISEGRLQVGLIRRKAAERLGTREVRRVRLLYKGRELKDDAARAGEEGLKQNSEITCVLSETPDDLSSSDGESPSEREIQQSRLDPDAPGSRRHGGGGRGGDRTGSRGDSASDSYFEPERRRARGGGNPSLAPRRPEDPRRSPASSLNTSSQSPFPRPTPAPSPAVFDPGLPSGAPQPLAVKQIAELERKWRTELLKPSEQLLNSPPSDVKKRNDELVKLLELTERDIILKADEIDTEGRPEIRQKRKTFINEVQKVLNRLDAAKKEWGVGKK